jgi:pyroglutamyl-peptidase
LFAAHILIRTTTWSSDWDEGIIMKILVTGFDPFDGEPLNPSWEAVRRLPDTVARAEIIKVQIPTSFGRSTDVVRAAILEHDPDVIVSVGQAGGGFAISPERVAVNVDDGRVPDNDGNQPIDTPIRADGPAAYFSLLPINAMVAAMKKAGIPAAVSNTAGTYVCNHIMYQVLYMIDREFSGKRGGFVHVPYSPQQVVDKPGVPSLGIDDITVALAAGIGAIVDYTDKPDEYSVGATIH